MDNETTLTDARLDESIAAAESDRHEGLIIRRSNYLALLREIKTLRRAIRNALDSAADEGVDKYRGTDEPREWVTILREELGDDDNG